MVRKLRLFHLPTSEHLVRIDCIILHLYNQPSSANQTTGSSIRVGRLSNHHLTLQMLRITNNSPPLNIPLSIHHMPHHKEVHSQALLATVHHHHTPVSPRRLSILLILIPLPYLLQMGHEVLDHQRHHTWINLPMLPNSSIGHRLDHH